MSANGSPNNNDNDTPNKDDSNKPKSPRPSCTPRCSSSKNDDSQPNDQSRNDSQADQSNRLEMQSSHMDLTDPKPTPPNRPDTDNTTIAESIVSSYDFLERNTIVTSLPDLSDISDNEGSLVEDNIFVKPPHHKKPPDKD